MFQSPYASLNPRRTVGQIVARPLRVFFDLERREARERVVAHLERVALSSGLIDRYPDQLSGGERQRVAVARALAAEPQILVCDEITSALDVSVQAALVELLAELQRSMNLGLLFITHNLALIRTIADRVAVMSAGRIVESAAVEVGFRLAEGGLHARAPGQHPQPGCGDRRVTGCCRIDGIVCKFTGRTGQRGV